MAKRAKTGGAKRSSGDSTRVRTVKTEKKRSASDVKREKLQRVNKKHGGDDDGPKKVK